MADFIRLRRAACTLSVLVLPLLSGCATEPEIPAFEETYGGYSGTISAREYGYVRPAEESAFLEGGTRERATRTKQTARGPEGDLWNRVRSGLQLEQQANARIDGTLERFRRDPQYLSKMSQRARPYLHVIVSEIERRGFPMELALLPHVESRFNPAATSPKAAAGIWQFMPYTGREMGLQQDSWYDGRRDILASTRAAMDYLTQLKDRFDGDWLLAMAAYNCGPGRVASAQEANRRNGRPTDFWSLDLPNETRQYVPQILATARLVAEPRKYGLQLPPVPDRPQLEVVRAAEPMDLVRVATASGVHLTELQRLNPGLKLGRTSPNGPSHLLVPAGTGQRVSAKLARVQVMPASPSLSTSRVAARQPAKPRFLVDDQVHVVKSGESLASIARALGMDMETLADWNGMTAGDPLLPGQSLAVPTTGAATLINHRVRQGDSISTIARRYGVTVTDIQRWNRIANARVKPGETIRIYLRAPATAS